MIARKNDIRIIAQPQIINRLKHPTDHLIERGDHRKIDVPNLPNEILRKLFIAIFGHALIRNRLIVRSFKRHQRWRNIDIIRINQRHVASLSSKCGMHQSRREIKPEGPITPRVSMQLINCLIRAVPIAPIRLAIIYNLRQSRATYRTANISRARPRADAVADRMLAISVIDRTNSRGLIPRALKGILIRGHILVQPFVIIPAIVIIGIFPAPHTRPRRIAHRAIRVRIRKQNPITGKAIHIRRGILHGGMPHTAHLAPIHAFSVNKNDIRLRRHF